MRCQVSSGIHELRGRQTGKDKVLAVRDGRDGKAIVTFVLRGLQLSDLQLGKILTQLLHQGIDAPVFTITGAFSKAETVQKCTYRGLHRAVLWQFLMV